MIFNNFRLLHLFRRPSSHPILKMVILVNECISHIDDGDGYGYVGGDMMIMMVILVVMMMMVILVV